MDADPTPYILATYGVLLAAGLAGSKWIVSQIIQQGKDLVRIQAALDYYLDRKGKGAAMILEASTNPTPEEAKVLLRKYREGRLSDKERHDLEAYLLEVSRANAEKYGAAQEMLAILGAQRRLDKKAVGH